MPSTCPPHYDVAGEGCSNDRYLGNRRHEAAREAALVEEERRRRDHRQRAEQAAIAARQRAVDDELERERQAERVRNEFNDGSISVMTRNGYGTVSPPGSAAVEAYTLGGSVDWLHLLAILSRCDDQAPEWSVISGLGAGVRVYLGDETFAHVTGRADLGLRFRFFSFAVNLHLDYLGDAPSVNELRFAAGPEIALGEFGRDFDALTYGLKARWRARFDERAERLANVEVEAFLGGLLGILSFGAYLRYERGFGSIGELFEIGIRFGTVILIR